MSGDGFGIFDDELHELEMDDHPDVHSVDDIESVLATMRHLPADELQQLRDNLQRSIPPNLVPNEDANLTSSQMLMLNAFTFAMFILFGNV